jgi:hypothetical protein
MSDARHHRAGRDRVQVIFVEVPAAGSPKQKYLRPPPDRYPVNQRQPWQPQQDIPRRLSKAEKLRNLVDGIARNDAAARDHMAEARRISAERRREEAGA